MSSPRYDRRVVQVKPKKDVKGLSKNINEALRQVSTQIHKLEGRGGVGTTFANTKIKSDSYTLMDFEGTLTGKASFSATTGLNRTFAIAKGARRETDGQWVATDTGAVILEMKDDGTMVMYANTNLVVGAAFNPTAAITLPTGTAPHGLVSASHTVGAPAPTAGQALVATSGTEFAFQDLTPSNITYSGAKVYTNTDITGITTTVSVLGFNTEHWDSANYHSTVSNNSRLTVPTTGYYLIVGRVRWKNEAPSSGYRIIRLEKNSAGTPTAGNVLAIICDDAATSGVVTDQEITTVAYLAATDYVELFAGSSQSTTSALYLDGAYDSPSLEIHFLGV